MHSDLAWVLWSSRPLRGPKTVRQQFQKNNLGDYFIAIQVPDSSREIFSDLFTHILIRSAGSHQLSSILWQVLRSACLFRTSGVITTSKIQGILSKSKGRWPGSFLRKFPPQALAGSSSGKRARDSLARVRPRQHIFFLGVY